MAKQPLPITTFQYPDGSPVANGSVVIRLSRDGSVNNTQVQRTFVTLPLDSSGVISGSPTFWPNSSISPIGSYYIFEVLNSDGQLVAGPNNITV